MEDLFVLMWKYSDNSDHGIVRAFHKFEDAQDLLKMFNEFADGSKIYSIEKTQIKDSYE